MKGGWVNERFSGRDGVPTGCALRITQTGPIIVDSGRVQGRRVFILLADYRLCVVRKDQVVGLAAETFAQLEDAGKTGDGP